MNPATLGLVISALAAGGSVLGVILSGVGKKGDQRSTAVNDQFKRQQEEIGYWQKETHDTRAALLQCQADKAPKDSQQ